jgi:hypothetical protein
VLHAAVLEPRLHLRAQKVPVYGRHLFSGTSHRTGRLNR